MKRFISCYQPQMDFGPGDKAVNPIYSHVALTPPLCEDTRAGGETLARPLLNIAVLDTLLITAVIISKLSIKYFQQLSSLPRISPFTVSDQIGTSFKGTELR